MSSTRNVNYAALQMIDMQVDPGLEREVHGMVEGYDPSDHECGQGVLGAHEVPA